MSDEDFEPFVGGPPPDPSERIWRHPSEIAAEARAGAPAAAGRTRRWPTPTWPTGSTASLLVAGSLGAAACITAIAVFQAVVSSPPSAADLAAATPSPSLGATLVGSDLPDAGPTDTAFDPNAASGGNPTTAEPTTTTIAAVTVSSTTTPALVEDAADHHLVTVRADPNTLLNGVVLGGYLFTGADAVDNRLSVNYQWQDRWTLAYLVGIDHYTDLAVFRTSGETRTGNVVRALTTGLTDASPSDAVPGLGIGDPILVASRTDDGLATEAGTVLAIETGAVTPAGQPLIDLIDTSARQPERSGGLLVDRRGDVAGIVVGTSSSLVSAVPTDRALAIADRLTQQGWANETWIGFMGIDQADGVEVVDVTADGPAAVAGLRAGDVISFLDGAPIDHMGGITAGLRRATPGDTLLVLVRRNGELIALRIEAAAYPTDRLSEPVGG